MVPSAGRDGEISSASTDHTRDFCPMTELNEREAMSPSLGYCQASMSAKALIRRSTAASIGVLLGYKGVNLCCS